MELTSRIGTPEFDAALTDATSPMQAGAALLIFIKNAMTTDPDLTLAQIEDRLRALDSSIYLIAKPTESAPETLEVLGQDEKPRPYWLWISHNGKGEAKKALADSGSADFADNREKLIQTGFVTIKRHKPE